MGLSVNITGLEFSDLQISRSAEGDVSAITVSGAVRNIGGNPKEPPVLRFGLLDRNSDEVRTWMVSLDGQPIPPGAARQFSTVVTDPPVSAVDLEATFATAAEARKAPAPVAHVAAAAAPTPAPDNRPKTGHASGGSNPHALTVIEPAHEDDTQHAPEPVSEHASEGAH
jgi:hypothetical protein